MNRIVIIVLTLLSSLSGYSQEMPPVSYKFNNSLKVSVTQFFAAEYRLTYERYLFKHRISVALSPAYILKKKPSIWLSSNDFEQLSGAGANLQLKLHLYNGKGPIIVNKGATSLIDIYFAPYAQYFYIKFVDENVTYTTQGWDNNLYTKGDPFIDIINAYEGGFNLGFEVAIYQRFMIDMYSGLGYRYADTHSYPQKFPLINTGYWSRGFTGIVPRLGINFGFAF